ncbi:MAG: hypothetical protein ACOYMR_10395 [Ilumatobacteraceae bacterium]
MGMSRAELAGALADLAESDRTVAKVLAASEAWETGYVAGLLSRAEELVSHDPPGAFDSVREQALTAIDRSIRHDNPFLRVHQSGIEPTAEQVDAIVGFLHQQAKFHDVAADLERRTAPRTPPPGGPISG